MFVNQLISIEEELWKHTDTIHAFFICWDVHTSKNLRKQIWPTYNANRKKAAQGTANIYPLITDLRTNLQKIHKRFNITHSDYEADDIIAVMKDFSTDLRVSLVIVSRDSDFFQLLDKNTTLYNPYEKELITEESRSYLNCSPSEYPLFKAVIGDKADNWPGVKGIGEQKARQFIEGNKTEEQLETITTGLRLIQLPFHMLDQDEMLTDIGRAFIDDSEINWTDFVTYYDLNRSLTQQLNDSII
jgi:5'-3' exonuclease